LLAMSIHQSSGVKLLGPLGPHRRRDTGDAFRPGAIGHPTRGFKDDPSLEAAVVQAPVFRAGRRNGRATASGVSCRR
jgi:hypothetical protein